MNHIIKIPNFAFVKANRSYSGSYQGMRWKVWIEEEQLFACAFPEPWSFACTPEEKKLTRTFLPTEEDFLKAKNWLNSCYSEHFSIWEQAKQSTIF